MIFKMLDNDFWDVPRIITVLPKLIIDQGCQIYRIQKFVENCSFIVALTASSVIPYRCQNLKMLCGMRRRGDKVLLPVISKRRSHILSLICQH